MPQPAIQFEQVSKQYRIGQPPLSLRSWLRGRRPQEESFHWALRDVGFTLHPGEALGIIGPNGAGKTTTLKLLSKVTYPTRGEIRMNGRFSSLIELGAGFHPELTGRENIFLNGTILGMKRGEIKARFDQIVDFAGIEKYLDTPVKRYSSGMYARLGFAVAAHVDPEILLVDEVLAVGDMAFQKKCYERMLQLIKAGASLVFISHNLRAVQMVCERCMVLYRGHKVFEGPSGEATAEYSNILRQAATDYRDEGPVEAGISQRVVTHGAVIEAVQLLRPDGRPATAFQAGEEARVAARVRFSERAACPIFACRITQESGQVIYDYTTHWAGLETPVFEAGSSVEVEFGLQFNLVAGTYHLGLNLAYDDLTRYYDRIDRALDFVVTGGGGARGIADLRAGFTARSIHPTLERAAEITQG
jgi:lipopolysaccharide transport system ATP-binding protein